MARNPEDQAILYHEATKHHPNRFARSLGYLDWATQPDPFRSYRGAPTLPLLLGSVDAPPSYDALYIPGMVRPRRVCLESVSAFCQFSLALSAWKEFQGSRWALRVNPSSGNLHPTEGSLVLGAVEALADEPGVFHYAPKDHALERRAAISSSVWARLTAGFPEGTFFTGLSSIHWREAWKYGERAYRYCQHDVGHALAALGMAAALQGWHVHPMTGMSDNAVGALLGLDRDDDFEGAEREHPDCLLAIVPSPAAGLGNMPRDLPADAVALVRAGRWEGHANRLSSDHVKWDQIDSVALACAKPATPGSRDAVQSAEVAEPIEAERSAVPARQIIQQRRSAVAMDGHTHLGAEQFYLMISN